MLSPAHPPRRAIASGILNCLDKDEAVQLVVAHLAGNALVGIMMPWLPRL